MHEEKSDIKHTKEILASGFKGLPGHSIRVDFSIVEKIIYLCYADTNSIIWLLNWNDCIIER
jgi:hypothetical protein